MVSTSAQVRLMRMLCLFLILWPLAPSADALREATRPCRMERLDHAYALCVDAVSDTRELAMDGAIVQTLSTLQAATSDELRELEARYAGAQFVWRRAVAAGCEESFPDEQGFRAECRLQAVLEREAQLAESLALASEDLGGALALDLPVPDEVEVLIPLPPGVNGPRHRVRVPLMVPVLP